MVGVEMEVQVVKGVSTLLHYVLFLEVFWHNFIIAHDDDIENSLNDILDASTEYVCSNGVGGAGFGSASANINALSLQTVTNTTLVKQLMKGLESETITPSQ